jgi:glycosidase
LFSHYKRLIHARNGHSVLNDNLSRLAQTGIRQRGIIAFVRRSATGNQVLVVHNLTGQPIDVVFSPDESWCRCIVLATAEGVSFSDDRVMVPGWGCVVLE